MILPARLRNLPRTTVEGWLLVTPAVILGALLVAYPFGYNIWLSFSNRTARRAGKFVGLDNYEKLLADADVYIMTARTLIWTAGTVVGQVVLGLALALFLNQQFRGRGFIRASLLVPYAMSVVTVVFIWKWLLNDINGIVNYTLLNLGAIGSPIVFLSGPTSTSTGWAGALPTGSARSSPGTATPRSSSAPARSSSSTSARGPFSTMPRRRRPISA